MTQDPKRPQVSVVLNTFNRSAELANAIASIFSQRFIDWEVIVVDDGSTDDTPSFLAMFDDPRLLVIRHLNMGLTASRNAGANAARGKWLAFLDDDDTVEPDWLEQLVGSAVSGTGMVFCGYQRVRPDGTPIRTTLPQPLGPAFLNKTGSYLPATWMMRRDVFIHAGGYLDGLPFIHQFELLLRAVRSCDELNLSTNAVMRPLLRYTERSPEERPMLWPRLALDGGRWILARHASALESDRTCLADHEGIVGVAAARCGRLDLARRHLARSLRAQPTNLKRWARLLTSFSAWTARCTWGLWPNASSQTLPLPNVHRLPNAHHREGDHLFLPWRYQGNPQASSDSEGMPYWETPSQNNTLYQEPVYRHAARVVRSRDLATVLDVGTGSGVKFDRHIRPVARRAVGFDQGSAIAIARDLFPSIEWVEGDMMDDRSWTVFDQQRFDLVICADVIEHVEYPLVLLEQITRTLGEHSRLLISTPDRLRFDRPTPLGPPENPRHVREWTRDEFELLLESVGLEIESQHRFLPRDYRPTLLEFKRNVWRLLHFMPIPDRRSNMAFLCKKLALSTEP